MPPKPKNTKQQIIDAALSVVRELGAQSLSARNIGKVLGASASSIFTHVKSMEEILLGTADNARQIYNEYVSRGLKQTPPFKGYAMEMVHFAMQEPRLFSMLFMNRSGESDLDAYLQSEGHLPLILQAIRETFGMDEQTAMALYRSLFLYVFGIATLCATGVAAFADEELSAMIGNACRGFIMSLQQKKGMT